MASKQKTAQKLADKAAAPDMSKLGPKKTTRAMFEAFGAHVPTNHRDKGRELAPTWEGVTDISNEISNYVARMAQDINESVEMVKIAGCEHVGEFNAAVAKTNDDFNRFIGDLEKVKAKHAGKVGEIKTPDDLALSLQVFEDYQQFRAYFEGVMHHSLISFTEFALEARDRHQAKLAEEEKKQAAEQPAAVVPEDQSVTKEQA